MSKKDEIQYNILQAKLNGLDSEFKKFCELNSLDHISADELYIQELDKQSTSEQHCILNYIQSFLVRYENITNDISILHRKVKN